MPSIQDVNAGANSTIDQLNTLISEEENNLGPLTAVGNDGKESLLSFDMDQPAPGIHAVLAEGVADAGVAPVCEGTVFISNALKDVYAIRNG